jgi:hypothetical protein
MQDNTATFASKCTDTILLILSNILVHINLTDAEKKYNISVDSTYILNQMQRLDVSDQVADPSSGLFIKGKQQRNARSCQRQYIRCVYPVRSHITNC